MTTVVGTKSMLDPVRHGRLLEDIEHVAATANITVGMIHTSAKGYCTPAELDWLRHFNAHREQGVAGLLITGAPKVPADSKIEAIVGALIRNFVDARVMGVNSILQAVQDGEMPKPTVLAIPNLFLRSAGKSMPDWRIHTIYDVLVGRRSAGTPTVVYVEHMEDLRAAYGPVFARFLETYYKNAGAV